MSKYPAFTRHTTGRLNVGDSILIRQRQDDQRCVYHTEPNPETGLYPPVVDDDKTLTIPTGVHQVMSIETTMRQVGHRSQRTYLVTLLGSDGVERFTLGTPPERWNVVDEADDADEAVTAAVVTIVKTVVVRAMLSEPIVRQRDVDDMYRYSSGTIKATKDNNGSVVFELDQPLTERIDLAHTKWESVGVRDGALPIDAAELPSAVRESIEAAL